MASTSKMIFQKGGLSQGITSAIRNSGKSRYLRAFFVSSEFLLEGIRSETCDPIQLKEVSQGDSL